MNERKAVKKIQVLDAEGKPVVNTKLNLSQKNHEFLFGCNAFDFAIYEKAEDPEFKKFLAARNEKWLELFNFGTLPFYWGQYEKVEGQTNEVNIRKAAEKLRKHDVVLKGHPLCWHTACADWLLNYSNEEILKKQLARIERDVTAFKGTIDAWDVINEVVILPHFDRYDNAVSRLCKEHGDVPLVKMVFDQAQKYNPNGTFLLNDFNTSPSYPELIERCLEAGVRIDVIGMQSHQHQGAWNEDKINEILGRLEQFNIPIHFTENTIVSGVNVPAHITDLNDFRYEDDASTPEMEEKQKNEMEFFYRNLFEKHPLVKAITNWDFGDGAWLNAPSGLVRRDNSEKPAYGMLKKLIKEEWWTNCDFTTDDKGFAQIEGYKGKYEIKSSDGKYISQEFALTSDNSKTDDVYSVKLNGVS